MKLFIPKLGTELTLLEPWTFSVYLESRNSSLLKLLPHLDPDVTGFIPPMPPSYTDDCGRKLKAQEKQDLWKMRWRWDWNAPLGTHTFPKGAVLIVDRIYIRQGQDDFDSVTFRAKYYHSSEQTGFGKKGKMVRFWAKLDDVNTMQVEDL